MPNFCSVLLPFLCWLMRGRRHEPNRLQVQLVSARCGAVRLSLFLLPLLPCCFPCCCRCRFPSSCCWLVVSIDGLPRHEATVFSSRCISWRFEVLSTQESWSPRRTPRGGRSRSMSSWLSWNSLLCRTGFEKACRFLARTLRQGASRHPTNCSLGWVLGGGYQV